VKKSVRRSVKNSGLVHVKREGEDITRDDLFYKWLIDPLHER
jgi:hypothetical protein